jgi:hypothetical protein
VHRWLTGGEFLFTSCFPWRNDLDQFAAELRELDRVGVAGVGIRLGSYVTEVSTAMCGWPTRSDCR